MTANLDTPVQHGPTPPLAWILEHGLPDFPPAKESFATHGRKARPKARVTLKAGEL